MVTLFLRTLSLNILFQKVNTTEVIDARVAKY